ncbi:MAG: HNH endonuclease family protein [Oscillospiraceae bacterium]|nr:HNH endonuclease family protein [Oscillospiraceae bacterium]
MRNESINETYKTELATILSSVDFIEAENSVKRIPHKQKDNKFTKYFRNFKFFFNKLSDFSGSKVNLFSKNILEKCEIIEIRSWQVEQAITMFNSLNSDGMPLLDADIISAQLYSEAEKLNQSEKFGEEWKNLLDVINILDSQKIADIDTILMQYMYINRARRKEYLSDKGSIDVTTPGLRRYYTEINKQILSEPLPLCEELLEIAECWLKIKDYPIIKLLLKFNANIKLYLSGYLSRYTAEEITEAKIKGICECLLRLFTVLELVDIGYSNSKFKTFLFAENIKLVDKNIDISEIEFDFSKHITRSWRTDDIQNEALEYDKNILVFLNEYLFRKSNGAEFVLAEKCEIEHIMPASGKNRPQIRLDADISDEGEFLSFMNKLGNKILLEESINKSIGNEWFRTKIQTSVTDKSGYKDSKYAVAAALVEEYKEKMKPYWLKDDISNATNKIAQRILEFVF